MGEVLEYSYDELINKSEQISSFASRFDQELVYLNDLVNKMNSNFRTDDSNRIYNSMNYLNEKSQDIKNALDKFALSIHDDIAPTYQAIETNLVNDTAINGGD
ncbi:MAG: hypothetical protein IKQ29_00515 [Bacilli bacterium]|nr:hypothetical protein [Bacilli bacterium]